MKKVFLSIVLMGVITMLNAQVIKFGLTAGATFPSQKVKSSGASITSDAKVGFTVGGLAEIPLTSEFVFQPGLNFTQKGSKFSFTDIDGSVEAKQTLSYIELPLNFLFQTNAGPGKFFAGVGPSLAYGIGGKAKSKTTFNGQTQEDSQDIKFGNNDNEDDYKPFEFGGNILAGYELSGGAFIALNYNLGFSNIAIGGDSDNSIKNRYFGVRLGYKFGGGRSK